MENKFKSKFIKPSRRPAPPQLKAKKITVEEIPQIRLDVKPNYSLDSAQFRRISEAIGFSISASLLLERAAKVLKIDQPFFRANLKRKVDIMIEEAKYIWVHVDKLKNLTATKEYKQAMSKDLNMTEDDVTDLLDDELTDEQALFSTFIAAYFTNYTPERLQTFYLILKNFQEGKPVYTKEDVLYLLEKQQKQLNPLVTYSEEYFEKMTNLE